MSNIIGIDVSKLSLDCAWLRDLDQDKQNVKGSRIAHRVSSQC